MIKEVIVNSKIYKVDFDESLDSISDKFHIEKSVLCQFNENRLIEKGDLIFIPKQNSAIHIVKPAETLESIAKKYDVTKDYIISKNNISTLFVGLKLYI